MNVRFTRAPPSADQFDCRGALSAPRREAPSTSRGVPESRSAPARVPGTTAPRSSSFARTASSIASRVPPSGSWRCGTEHRFRRVRERGRVLAYDRNASSARRAPRRRRAHPHDEPPREAQRALARDAGADGRGVARLPRRPGAARRDPDRRRRRRLLRRRRSRADDADGDRRAEARDASGITSCSPT